MKNWKSAEILDLAIEMTANGRNEHAVEANKFDPQQHPDKGAGIIPDPNPGYDNVVGDNTTENFS